MNIKFPKPLAYSKNYPEPIIQGGMIFRSSNLLLKRKKQTSDSSFFVVNSRSGLAIIGQHLQLKKGDTVLLPSYHCPALVEPFIWLGVNIRFYNLNKDLSVEVDDFISKIDDTVKVCLFVHYFGFPSDLSELALMLKNKKIAIIEDCAHSFYTPAIHSSRNLGDFFVVSCNKFFPCTDGSIVFGIKDTLLKKKLVAPSLLSDLKVFLNLLPFTVKLIEFIKKIIPTTNSDSTAILIAENNINNFRYFNPHEITQTCSRVTQFVVEHSDHKKLKQARQKNFRYLLKHLINSEKGKPLFTEFSDKVIPYVFPFLLNKTQYFDDIKNAGLALFRWEESAESSCSNSKYYRKHLIQIPCHQDLSQDDLNAIIRIVK